MSLIAEFHIHSTELVLHTGLVHAPSVTIEIETEMATASKRPILVFWASGDRDRFERGLNRDETVESYTVLEAIDGRTLYRTRLDTTDAKPVFPTYHRVGAVPLAATASHKGWDGRVRFPTRDALAEFRAFCADSDIDFQLDALYTTREAQTDDEYGLTPDQSEAVLAALDAGYYEIPRDVTLSELGDSLGISAQSVSERLRRGQARLARSTLAKSSTRYKRPESSDEGSGR